MDSVWMMDSVRMDNVLVGVRIAMLAMGVSVGQGALDRERTVASMLAVDNVLSLGQFALPGAICGGQPPRVEEALAQRALGSRLESVRWTRAPSPQWRLVQ